MYVKGAILRIHRSSQHPMSASLSKSVGTLNYEIGAPGFLIQVSLWKFFAHGGMSASAEEGLSPFLSPWTDGLRPMATDMKRGDRDRA
jgi:hypothetical protein